GWKSVWGFRDGGGVWPCRRTMLRPGDGGGVDLGEFDQERRAWIHLPVRFFAWDVRATRGSRPVQRQRCPSAEGRRVGGLDQATVRVDHAGGCGVLPCANGAAPHLIRPLPFRTTQCSSRRLSWPRCCFRL